MFQRDSFNHLPKPSCVVLTWSQGWWLYMWLFAAIAVRFRPVPMTGYRILMRLYHSNRSMNGRFYLGYIKLYRLFINIMLYSWILHGVWKTAPWTERTTKQLTEGWPDLSPTQPYERRTVTQDNQKPHQQTSGMIPRKTNMTMENPPFEDVYFLLKDGDFPLSC